MAILKEEEEYKKRLERAKKLRNSVGIYKTDEIKDFNTNIVSNSSVDFQSNLERAKKLRQSMGIYKSDELQNITSKVEMNKSNVEKTDNADDVTIETFLSENEANKPKENLSTNKEENISKNGYNATVSPSTQNVRNVRTVTNSTNLLSNKPISTVDNMQAYEKDKGEDRLFYAKEFEDGYQFGDVTKTALGTLTDAVQDVSSGFVSGFENILDIGTNVVATIQNIIGNTEGAKRTREFANKDLSTTISSKVANATPVGALYNIVNGTPEKIFNPAGVQYDRNKSFLENMQEMAKKTYLTYEKQDYESSSALGGQMDNLFNLTGYALNLAVVGSGLSNATGTKVIGSSKLGMSLSGGNIGINIGGHTLNLPTLSIAGGMAGGLEESNSKENVSEIERWSKALFSGFNEAFTEGLFGFLGVGGNDITEELEKKVIEKCSSRVGKLFANLGFQATGEAVEEFLSYASNFLTDNLIVNNLGEADFSSEWKWADVFEQMGLAFASTFLMGSASAVIDTNSAVKTAEQEIGRPLSNEEKKQVTKAQIDGTIEQIITDFSKKTVENTIPFYTIQLNQEGKVVNIKEVNGKQIDNPNKKVNINPVIVKNSDTDGYNIVDYTTGLLLDGTTYPNTTLAQSEFSSKMINLDEASIKGINEKIVQANIAINEEIGKVIQETESQLRNTSKNVENDHTATLSNDTTNYSSDEANLNMEQNKNNIVYDIDNEKSNIIENHRLQLPSTNNDIASIDNSIPQNTDTVKNLTDDEIRDIVKYNQDGREIKDSNYVDFIVERYKDNINISGIEIDTKAIQEILNKSNSRNEALKKIHSKIQNPNNIELNILLKNTSGKLEKVDLDIDITLTGLKESFNKGESIGKYAIVPYLDKIIKRTQNGNGYFVMHDDKNRTEVKGYYYLFNTVEIDNKLYTTKIDIKKTRAGDRFYVHRVKLINNEGASIQANNSLELEVPVGQEAPSIDNSIPQNTNSVKTVTNSNYTQNNSNNALENIAKLVSQISENSIYQGTKVRSAFNSISKDIPNIQVVDDYDMTYINSLDKEGNVVYQQKLQARPYTGKQVINLINNAMENADLSNVNVSENVQNDRRAVSGKTVTNVSSNESKTNVGQNKEKKGKAHAMPHENVSNMLFEQSPSMNNNITQNADTVKNLTDDEIRDIVKYNQDGREIKDSNYVDFIVERYKDNINISGIETNTKYIEQIKLKNKNEIISDLFTRINDKSFESKKDLLNKENIKEVVKLDVEITKTGLNESFHKGISDEKYAIVPYLDVIIKTSQNGIIRDETKGRSNIKGWYYLYNTAIINGQLYSVKIDLKQTDRGDRLYVHRVNLIHKKELSSQAITEKSASDTVGQKAPSIDNSISQNTNSVKTVVNSNYTQKDENDTSDNGIRSMKKVSTKSKPVVTVDPAIQKELHNRIQNAILSNNSKKNTFLGEVSQNVVNKVKSLFGIDVSGRQHIISDNDIRHIIKQHGNPIIEKGKGQIAITTKDIEKIPDIINNYDKIERGNLNKDHFTKENYDTIRYVKQYDNGIIYVIEVIPTTSNRLNVKTMWKKPLNSNKKNNSIRVNHDNNNIVPQNTSETKPKSSYSDTSIQQNTENVKTDDAVEEEVKTNAERTEAWIEQEIVKIEQSGNWDDSIPATKRSDIRKTIEDYLGLGIKKGHFRQHAYGIYKNNRDVIRTKELKDIDTILHETGHALDLGNRLKINKESIAEELISAIDKLEGYENESKAIKLEEGFAEVIREYAIIPEQAKIDYPQTVTIIEGIQQQDKSFDNFITKLQKQIYNYIHQNPRNRELGNQNIGETDKQPLTKEWIKQETMRNIYDRDYALKKAVKVLAEAGGKTTNSIKASENAYLLTRLTSGTGDKIVSILSKGYIDENKNKLMPGLNKIGEILGNDPERYNDLRVYLVAQRDLEYKAKSLKTGLRTMDSKTVVEQFKNDTQIQEASQLVYDTLDGVLQYAVNNGLITEENAKALRESNTFYVPMQRALERRGNQVGRRGAVGDIVKRRTGSELDIKDVLENIIANSANIIQQVENNNILKALYKEGESSGLTGSIYDVIDTPVKKVGTAKLSTWENELKNQGVDIENIDFEKTIDIFAPNNKIDKENLITSFINDNGKRVYLQFNDEIIFNSLMNMDKQFMSQVLEINRKLNMPLRYGATMANVGFAIPNMISDTMQASIYSTAGFIPVVDNALGVLEVLSANNKAVRKFMQKVAPQYAEKVNIMYALYEQSGAMSATRLSQYREATQGLMSNVYGTKNSQTLGINERFKPLKRVLDLLTYIPELSEQSTRFRVFERNYNYYLSKGNSETDARLMAAIEARDSTQDFSRTGNLMREVNQVIPFSAARVGSAYTFAEKVRANPKQVTMRTAILITIAMIIQGIGYNDDEIEELNQRKKNDNFVFKIGDTVITIKKPQGVIRSIINLAEYIQDLATGHIEEGKEGERLVEWVETAIMDNMPADEISGLVPNALAPAVENAVNKDFYYNTDIVKSYDLDLPDYMQYYDYNSQLAIWLGKIFNYSPAKIDNLISGYFGGLGTQVTDAIDFIAGKLGISAEEPAMGAEDNAIGKRFVVNVNENSASVDDVYTEKTELTKKKNGGTITVAEEEKLEILTEATTSMATINKQIRAIKADLTMSAKKKAEKIKELQEQRTDIARQALGKEIIHPENEDKIASTKFYPSRNTLSLNGYSLELTDDMKKEYEEIAYGRYSQYEKQGIYSQEKLEQLESQCKDYAKQYLMKKYKSKLTKTK